LADSCARRRAAAPFAEECDFIAFDGTRLEVVLPRVDSGPSGVPAGPARWR